MIVSCSPVTRLDSYKRAVEPGDGVSLLDTVGKLFEKILLTTVLREVNERGRAV
jgi:hypothetical protein